MPPLPVLLDLLAQAQPLVLAPVLLAAGLAKLASGARPASSAPPQGLAALVRPRYERAVTILIGAAETAAGFGLLLVPVPLARLAALALLVAALGVLLYLRRVRPQAGCGCFGSLSSAPIGRLTMLRTAALVLAAVAGLSARDSAVATLGQHPPMVAVLALAELAVLAAISPELRERLERRRKTADGPEPPCAVRNVPHEFTVAALRESPTWRHHRPSLTASEPIDIWREACWRFYVFPAKIADRDAQVVFAVRVEGDPPPVKAAVVSAEKDRVLATGV